MNDTTPPRDGRGEELAAWPFPGAGMASFTLGYSEAVRTTLWALEGTRMMLEVQRSLLDLGRDLIRRQQDEMIAAALRTLEGKAEPHPEPIEGSFADLTRMGLDTLQRVAAAVAATGPAPRSTGTGTPNTEPDPRQTAA